MNLNDLDEEAFVAALDGVVEHSPWVAREAYRRRPFASASELGSALADAMRDAPVERRVALVRAHPGAGRGRRADRRVRLASRPARGSTAAATRSARSTPPTASASASRSWSACASTRRSRSSPGARSGCSARARRSSTTALGEIAKIAPAAARGRGRDLHPRARHVARAAGRRRRRRRSRRRRRRRARRSPTPTAASPRSGSSPPGRYRLVFDTAAHSEFFPRVSVDFTVGDERLHVPLLLNPFGYSTYRGS